MIGQQEQDAAGADTLDAGELRDKRLGHLGSVQKLIAGSRHCTCMDTRRSPGGFRMGIRMSRLHVVYYVLLRTGQIGRRGFSPQRHCSVT